MADRTVKILVKVDSQGNPELREAAKGFAELNNNVNSVASSFSSLKNAFLGYLAIGKLREVAGISDSMQLLYDRITTLTGSTKEASFVFDGLLERANRTRTPIAVLAETFARLSSTTKETGISSKLLLDVTETLQNTFRLSGATAEEAASASIQLSQGLALGTLRGQDLKAVLSSNVEFGNALAKQLGKTRGELYKFAESGKIRNPDVFKAIFKAMDDINGRAETLKITFGQSLVKATNDFSAAVLKLNKELDLSGKFATGLQVLQERMGLIAVALFALAATQIPLLIGALGALGTASLAFVAANPLLIAVGAISLAFVVLFKNLSDFKNKLIDFATFFLVIFEPIAKFTDNVQEFAKSIAAAGSQASKFERATGSQAGLIELGNTLQGLKTKIDDVGGSTKSTKAEQDAFIKGLKTPPGDINLKEILGDLNKLYLAGAISLDTYNQRLIAFDGLKADFNFTHGKTDINQRNDALNKMNRELAVLNYNTGKSTFSDFNESIRNLDIEQLNNKFRSGKIELKEYDEKLLALDKTLDGSRTFRVGVQGYLDSVGTLATGLASVITGTFKRLEDSLVAFVKTGKFNFADFTSAVLEDLERIIIRATIIAPLAKGLLNFASPGSTAASQLPASNADFGNVAAKGMAFNEHSYRMFASGGIVNTPTAFSFNKSSKGIMGEAGPEAIIPLSRSSGGDLGIKASVNPVSINIINNAGADVTQTESTDSTGAKVIDVLIKQKVAEGFATGSFDKVMSTSYGLRRKGS